VGDYIKLNTGEEGYVTDIGWRSTTLRALAHNLIIVPNAKLAQAIVTNYYMPDRRVGANFVVTVGYEQDADAVEKMLLEVLEKAVGEIPGLLADPAPSVGFEPGFGESGYGFTLNFQVVEFAEQTRVRNELRRRVMRRLREEGIAVPYAARTLYLRGAGKRQQPQ
jgi:small-conductance mechanosensitive channel